MKMKNIVVILIILGVLWMYTSTKYNAMVSKDEIVQTAWSQVENQYQRRYDLVPNLVETVKWYAEHEQETLTAVIEARSKATNTTVDINDAASLGQFQASQWALSSALSRLMVVVEKYPDLKANQGFLELQAQLEWTENRISVERMRFNETVQNYNVYIRSFPNNMLAWFFDFDKAALFEAEQWSNQAPKVDFEK